MLLQKHKGSIILWLTLPVLVFAVFHLVSDGDFSFLLTVGSMTRGFAFFLLSFKIMADRSGRELSLKSLTCYVCVFFARLLSVLWQQGYLPFDRSGDWLYQACEIFSLLMAIAAFVLTAYTYRKNYNTDADTFGTKFLPKIPGALLLIVPALLLALLVHPSLNSFFVTDCAWAFACYLETLAIIPQMTMIKRGGKGGKDAIIEPYTAHWMFSLALARLFHVIFWIFSYHELNQADQGFIDSVVGFVVMGFQILQLVIMMDYIYFYLRSAVRGENMKMPTNLSLV